MIPQPMQMPMFSQMSEQGTPPIKAPTIEPPARTAYDIRYETTLSPFVRAKYGLGGGPPTSLNQLTEPRMASGAARPVHPQLSKFTPSGMGVETPRLNPLQFGGEK